MKELEGCENPNDLLDENWWLNPHNIEKTQVEENNIKVVEPKQGRLVKRKVDDVEDNNKSKKKTVEVEKGVQPKRAAKEGHDFKIYGRVARIPKVMDDTSFKYFESKILDIDIVECKILGENKVSEKGLEEDELIFAMIARLWAHGKNMTDKLR